MGFLCGAFLHQLLPGRLLVGKFEDLILLGVLKMVSQGIVCQTNMRMQSAGDMVLGT